MISTPEIDSAQLAAVRNAFFERGEDVASWARARGFHPASVYRVLSGQSKVKRGASHEIAVALGLKKNSATNPADLAPRQGLQ